MKNILVSFLMLLSLSSFAKKKEKPALAFKKRHITAFAGTGFPNAFGYQYGKSVGPINVGASYQASKRWSFGLQYSFNKAESPYYMRHVYSWIGATHTVIDSFQYKTNETYHSIMATADICYVNRGRVCLSSGIGLGYSPVAKVIYKYMDNVDHSADMGKSSPLRLAFRLSLLNAKVKIKDNFGVYGGFGYGVDGFLLIGAHYTFKGKNDD